MGGVGGWLNIYDIIKRTSVGGAVAPQQDDPGFGCVESVCYKHVHTVWVSSHSP